MRDSDKNPINNKMHLIIVIREIRKGANGFMYKKKVYICEDSIDGIFTAIYKAWESKAGHNNIKIIVHGELQNYELFSEYIEIDTIYELANKVGIAIRNKISEEAYQLCIKAALCEKKEKADNIYRFLLLGFSYGKSVCKAIHDPLVSPIFEMSRNVERESMHYKGFLRFFELKNHILIGEIIPKNDILTLLAPHFSDRFFEENFLILDEKRKKSVVHYAGKGWILTSTDILDREMLEQYTEKELAMQQLWKLFVDTIAIKERKNIPLQMQMLPKKYRKFMKEL